ncbi:MAG: NHLP bacteriocin system secretion protein [Candidatus Riflebacteria bacterium]|nr:NHLP bacteriocin system secretion protein [Candidatus Riflebacteria bacterium]
MDASQLFRKKALDQLASPDQLDRVMRVTNPVGWMALFAVGVLLAAAGVWSVKGQIPTKVRGRGILLSKGGVKAVQAAGSGRIAAVMVKVGDRVKHGDVVARLQQPELEQQQRQLGEQLAQAARYKEIQELHDRQNTEVNRKESEQRRGELQLEIAAAQEQIKYMEGKLKAEQEALGLGLIPRDVAAQTLARLQQEKGKVESAKSSISGLAVKDQAAIAAQGQALERRAKEVDDLTARLAAIAKQLELTSKVVSFYDGRVSEVPAGEGEFVQVGGTLVSIEPHDAPLHALILIVEEGKRIRPGMVAEIAPATAKRELFGYMFGTITSVSSMPSTQSALMHILRNPDLVKQLSGGDAPFTMYAELVTDKATPSGFKWSSSGGPPTQILAGTVCTVEIVVEKQRPIELVAPYLKDRLGL